jgi:cellulose biosynthesis protein BcsQ
VGDLGLSGFEGKLSESWPKCLDSDNESYFRIMTAFFRVIEKAAQNHNADLVLVDVGPNLGAINRSALIASQHVILPLTPDLFSLQGLRNLGLLKKICYSL